MHSKVYDLRDNWVRRMIPHDPRLGRFQSAAYNYAVRCWSRSGYWAAADTVL
jgi:hypothetical protein